MLLPPVMPASPLSPSLPSLPQLHFFVCANRRPADSPLGAGCGAAGEAVFAALKQEVAKRGAYRAVWVTQTLCLGVCPRRGCTVALYPAQQLLAEIEPADVAPLFANALGSAETASKPLREPCTWERIDAILGAMEELQTAKVIDLARRLKPGLTLEDVRNPHDFPELGDPDWHYEDGVLTGIQSVRTALRARGAGGRDGGEQP